MGWFLSQFDFLWFWTQDFGLMLFDSTKVFIEREERRNQNDGRYYVAQRILLLVKWCMVEWWWTGGRNDGCRCVCVTQIGLFIRYKSNINIALVTARLPLHWSPSVCQCENHRRREEPEPEPIPHYEWPVLGLGPPLALDISNKTRIQIKWAEIWCNYLNATLCHKTKEKFFIAALSEMRTGTRKFSSLCFLFAICVCHNYRKSLPWISIWTFNYNPWLDMKYLFLSF